MHSLKYQFPNMDSLITFEAAARLSSFAKAGLELHITASAVSQQIKALEKSLRVDLFSRGHRSVQLTQAGQEFSNSVLVALTHLSNAASDLSDDLAHQQMTIAADTSLTACWLMPKIEKLRREFPDHRFRIFTSDSQDDLINSEFHFAFLHGRGHWQGVQSRLLFKEEVFPVCSPSYVEQLGSSVGLLQIESADLLDLEYEKWDWMNWTIWMTEIGLSPSKTSRKIVSNNYASLIDAAKLGMGIALAWRHLHDADLASGALVAPLSTSVKTNSGYHLAWPFNQPKKEIDHHVRDWLVAECTDEGEKH